MAIVVGKFKDVGASILYALGAYKADLATTLFENLLEATPVDTGTLKANWKGTPGNTAGRGFKENTGRKKKTPKEPNFYAYTRKWHHFTISNNSPYIGAVNDGIGGNAHNKNFIQIAIAKTHRDMKNYVEKGFANA